MVGIVHRIFVLGRREEHELEPSEAYLDNVISTKALPLCGALLRLVCTRAGITQTRLARDAKTWLRPGEKIDIYQPTISEVSQGKREPSYRQLWVWLRAIRAVYEDPDFPRKCLANRMPCYPFPKDLEMDIRRLALKCDNDEDIAIAYERRRNMVLELTRVEWRNGIEPRWSSGSPDEDPPPAMQGAPIDRC